MSEPANYCIDANQNCLAELGHGILDQLLADRTTGQNILWATNSYDFKGAGFAPCDQILPELIIGENAGIIQPRVAKAKAARLSRTKSRAEVGTPAWVCNVQNNLVDNRWLNYEGAFNRECNQSWLANPHPVFGDDDGRWREYVGDLRLEMACGEAPYLSSRYDMATGEPIEVPRRVGILDRKLRVVGENSHNRGQWLEWAYRALESVYGFELQGDSLFIARKNLLLTFAEHYMDRFGVYPSPKSLKTAAGILSWNLWQMDARTFAVPFEKVPREFPAAQSFDRSPIDKIRYCFVKDWRSGETRRFFDLSVKDRVDRQRKHSTIFFHAIVGNPPYQEGDGGAGASARALYPAFVDMARAMRPDFISMIIPSKWFAGGKHLGSFRKSMLADAHIEELHDCIHPEQVFPGTNNRGGVCYFLWNDSYDNTKQEVKVVTHEEDGVEYQSRRPLLIEGMDIFVRNSRALSILDKVFPANEDVQTMPALISPSKPFGLRGSFVKDPAFHSTPSGLVNPIKCYGKSRAVGYIEREIIQTRVEWIDEWKVFMPYANNIGTELRDDNQNTIIGEPGSVCTETFLVAGASLKFSKKEAENLSSYLRTKFARFLLSLAKVSQHGTREFYRFVPAQDFSIWWDDRKLYAKYKLVDEEIAYIENAIKSMQ